MPDFAFFKAVKNASCPYTEASHIALLFVSQRIIPNKRESLKLTLHTFKINIVLLKWQYFLFSGHSINKSQCNLFKSHMSDEYTFLFVYTPIKRHFNNLSAKCLNINIIYKILCRNYCCYVILFYTNLSRLQLDSFSCLDWIKPSSMYRFKQTEYCLNFCYYNE